MALAINDGTTTCEAVQGSNDTSSTTGQVVSCVFTYTASATRVFELYVGSTAGTVTIPNGQTTPRISLKFHLERFPSTAEQVYSPSIAAWKIDANISGADVSLGTSAQTAYIAPNDASLTLTQNSGSSAVGISCSSTNDNTVGATTCSAGSEELGFVADLPRIGTIRVCYSFAHQIVTDAFGVLNATFQVVQTANGSQTVGIEGKGRVQSGLSTGSTSVVYPVRLCGEIPIATAGKNTIRLMYEQTVTATVTTNAIHADAGASNGQRDVHITAEYIDQNVTAPILINSVSNSSSGVTAVEFAKLNCDAGSAITSQHGSWVASIGNVSAGACSVTLSAGKFSATPYCTAVPATTGGFSTGLELNVDATSATAVSVDCEDDASSACTSFDFILSCAGAK